MRCYQCASSQNLLEDNCGAYKTFDKDSHIAVDCYSEETNIQGAFCMKLTQQGPKGFICKYSTCFYSELDLLLYVGNGKVNIIIYDGFSK